MTRIHHMTLQTTAGAGPEDTPCRMKVEKAFAEKQNRSQPKQTCNTMFSTIRSFAHLGELFGGPAQFEKPRNITAL